LKGKKKTAKGKTIVGKTIKRKSKEKTDRKMGGQKNVINDSAHNSSL